MDTIEQAPQELIADPAPEYTRITGAAILPAETVHPGELLRMAMTSGRDIDTIERLMGLQDRYEATVARKAFNAALSQFHAEHIKVVRATPMKQGPMAGMKYARLSDFTKAIAEPLAAAGLSVSWRLLQDAKDWLEVACVVRHVLGHQEETRMSGPPDQTGSKNAIQARASTVSYLEKYTLKMALGLAEQDDDDDGNGGDGDDTGKQTGGAPPTETKPEKPTYSADDFAKNFPSWEKAIQSGKRNHGEIITMAETRGKLSDEQKRKIKEVKANEAA